MIRTPILFLCCLLSCFAFGQSGLCSEFDPTTTWYATVTAKSGLVLRDGPSPTASKIVGIPYGEKVFMGPITDITHRVDSTYGHWQKVCWKNQSGYAFNGYLLPEQTSIGLYMPDGMDGFRNMDTTQEWTLLVEQKKKNIEEATPLRLYKAIVKSTKESSWAGQYKDFFFARGSKKRVEMPIFAAISGIKTDSVVLNYAHGERLLPGAINTYSLNDPVKKCERRYYLVVTGSCDISTNYLENGVGIPIDTIQNYKVTLIEKMQHCDKTSPEKKKQKSQVLFNQTARKPNDMDTYEVTTFSVYFAGDLDGDHQLDLILQANGWQYFVLYLSSQRIPGYLLRLIAGYNMGTC